MRQSKTQIKVAVLLTTYESSKYIYEQVESIINQIDVSIYIFLSDDLSTDSTLEIIDRMVPNSQLTVFKNKSKFGRAGLNFLSLVERVDISGFDYVCFSDHDDIWKVNKLIEGIKLLTKYKAQGYSSGYTNYKEGKKNKPIISKNSNQKEYDYLFSSPGPGCTFILEKNSFINFQNAYRKHKTLFSTCFYHDWLIYVYYRINNFKWIIDERSFIDYRQHDSNETGANIGLKAVLKRITMFKNGFYETEIRKMYQITRIYRPEIEKVMSGTRYFRFLIIMVTESRRNLKEALVVTALFLFQILQRGKIFKSE